MYYLSDEQFEKSTQVFWLHENVTRDQMNASIEFDWGFHEGLMVEVRKFSDDEYVIHTFFVIGQQGEFIGLGDENITKLELHALLKVPFMTDKERFMNFYGQVHPETDPRIVGLKRDFEK